MGSRTWAFQRTHYCHDPRAMCHIAGFCHRANSTAHHPRATYHTAGCWHLVNSLSWFQSHMPHCKSFFAIFYFYFFCFSMQFGLWRVTAFVSSPIHLFVLGFLTRIFAVIGAGAVVFCAPIFNRFKPNFISSILFVYFPLCFIFNASVDNSFSILILFRFWLILIFCGILTENWVEK